MSTSIPYMMTANLLSPLDYSSKNLDHLGIVATVCKEIGLADEINRIVGVDPRQKVTCGEAVVAMVLNALGFVDRPLYLFPEFMATKPVEILITSIVASIYPADKKRFPLFELVFALEFKPQNLILEPSNFKKV